MDDEIEHMLGDSLGELLQRVGHPLPGSAQPFQGFHITSMEALREIGSSAGSEAWPRTQGPPAAAVTGRRARASR